MPFVPISILATAIAKPLKMDADLSDILNRSRAVCDQQNYSTFAIKDSIPRLERALDQIDDQSRNLVSNDPTSTTAKKKEEALRLLSSYGFETDRIERSLQSIALKDAFEPLHATPDTDIASFLEAQAQLTISAAVEVTNRQAETRSLKSLSAFLDAEWETIKRDRVALPLLFPSSSKHSRHDRPASNASLFESPFRQPRASRLSSSFDLASPSSTPLSIYHPIIRRVVYERNVPGAVHPVATLMDDALLSHMAPRGDPLLAQKSVQHLHAVFNALRYMSGEPAATPSLGAFENLSVEKLQRQLCVGAQRYLCLQYREDKMKKEIELRPMEARRGGVPGVRADVRAFLNLVFDRGLPEQLTEGPMHDGLPVWAFVYYCLRSGYVEEAVRLVEECVKDGCPDKSLRIFSECLRCFVDSGERRCLPPHLLERLIQDYRVAVKDGADPYCRVCYVVIARVDPSQGDAIALLDSDYGLLFYSIEDYLWLRLSIARLAGDDALPASLSVYGLTLKEIGEDVKRFGAGHFNADGDSALVYALVLILTGELREAVRYLSEKGRALTEAVHITYIMYHYGMIRDGKQVAGGTGSGEPESEFEVDYAELVWKYTSRLSRNDPGAAVLYVFTIRDRLLRRELLKKILVEFDRIETVIGREGHDGIMSTLWKREESDGDLGREGWRTVVVEAGEEAEKRGEREKALKLYDIGGLTSRIAGIHLKRLGAEVSYRGSAMRERVIGEAEDFVRRCGDKIDGGTSDKVINSLEILIKMAEFFDLRWAERFDEAVSVLEKMPLIPKSEAELGNKVTELSFGSRIWTTEVIEKVPELIVCAMEVLGNLYRRGSSNANERSKLRHWARNLVNLCGMMRNLSADMSARLVGLEVLMT